MPDRKRALITGNGEKLSATGWSPRIDLDEGVAATYRWYCDHHGEAVPA